MKRLILSMRNSLFLGIGLVLLFTVTSARGANDDAYDQGRRLYVQKCQLCHGVKGNGQGPAASAFNPEPADFAVSSFWERFDEKAIGDIIKKGRGQMPSFDLTPDDTQAIIDYMSHTFKPGK